ncbi:MAG: DUF327 domain-containing protein [Fretibacterium sp.]|nr:DUF327 domain-containing protein [Fretibacterium sp.]
MKVKGGSGSGKRVEYGGGGGGRSHSAGAVAPAATFGRAMEETEVRLLLERLDAVASRLTIFPAERLLVEYRAVLMQLLRRAMEGFSLRRDLRWRKTTRMSFLTIERAEDALQELEEVFKREGDRSRAIALMEEIKGCLISLLF